MKTFSCSPLVLPVFYLAITTLLSAADLPTNPVIQHGSVEHVTSGQIMAINQSTPSAIVHYDDFSIGIDHTVNINTPTTDSAFLGRVTGSNISNILGRLNSNGIVYLVNPNGIFFGKNAVVNVHKLVAATLNLTDDDFINRRADFDVAGTGGTIENHGTITAQAVTLLAEKVENDGRIEAHQIGLGAGHNGHILTDESGGGKITIDFTDAEIPAALVRNDGEIDSPVNSSAADQVQIISRGDIAGRGSITSSGDIVISAAGDVEVGAITSSNGDVTIVSGINLLLQGNISANKIDFSNLKKDITSSTNGITFFANDIILPNPVGSNAGGDISIDDIYLQAGMISTLDLQGGSVTLSSSSIGEIIVNNTFTTITYGTLDNLFSRFSPPTIAQQAGYQLNSAESNVRHQTQSTLRYSLASLKSGNSSPHPTESSHIQIDFLE